MSMFEKTSQGEAILDGNGAHIFKITSKDISHVIPTARMMLERLREILGKGEDAEARNIYSTSPDILPTSILDVNSISIGHQLMYRFALKEGMFGLSVGDIPSFPENAPRELVNRRKRTKSTTIQRATCRSSRLSTETKRQAQVKKMKKSLDCMFSEMNTCQAILKPDCTKANVPKSTGVKSAALFLIQECIQITQSIEDTNIYHEDAIPDNVSSSVTHIIIEFAGVKFKIPERNTNYLDFVERTVFAKLRYQFPLANHVVVCEEKYTFTPDDLKAPTREKRNPKGTTISHLKPTTDILTSTVLSRKAVTTTAQGKQAISIYLAHHVEKLDLRNVIVDVNSEFHMSDCHCQNPNTCDCPNYAVPLRAVYGPDGLAKTEKLIHIHQRKGEAEMSQIDWLVGVAEDLVHGESVLSVVSSGDIDALIIHLFSVSRLWPRTENSGFSNKVYLMLQKPFQKYDMYCITGMIELMEKMFGKDICPKVAIALCIGGNDFIPKFSGFSHVTVLKLYLSRNKIQSLLTFEEQDDRFGGRIDEDMFLQGIKELYCPKMYSSSSLSLDEVRQLSIKNPFKTEYNSPDKWMPPVTALRRLLALLHCQLDYLLMAGFADAKLPDFQSYGCLKEDDEGNVRYDLGQDIRVQNKHDLLRIPEEQLKRKLTDAKVKHQKRKPCDTPQKGQQRKRKVQASTPRKELP